MSRNRLANELIGDFKEVEDNFKEITRKIYERQQQQDLVQSVNYWRKHLMPCTN